MNMWLYIQAGITVKQCKQRAPGSYSLARAQYYDFPTRGEGNLIDMGEYITRVHLELICIHTKTKPHKFPAYLMGYTVSRWINKGNTLHRCQQLTDPFFANIDGLPSQHGSIASIINCETNDLSSSNPNDAAVEVSEWFSNFTWHFTERIITHPGWDSS